MSIKNLKVFMVECSTGCSCCSNENHDRGPYSTQEIAVKKIELFRQKKLLASQYSKTGVYCLQECDAEQLEDGRLIVENKVYKDFVDEDNGDMKFVTYF